MVFSSLNFLFLFLPVTLLLHTLAPKALRNPILLIASLYFYAWGEPVYVLLMLMSIIVNYIIGLQMESTKESGRRDLYFLIGVIADLLVLGFYKYYGFVAQSVFRLFGRTAKVHALALPIGISFYTFQALSYLIDVRRKNTRAQKSFVDFATYIVMFPQLVAGPIVKYNDIETQLKQRAVTLPVFGLGVRYLIIGLAKKVILANNLGLLHTSIQQSAGRSLLSTWLGAIAYMLQIYFDFSGYSDMAIGMGRMLGFKFEKNFNYPYTARSITDFWRRWHISLSSWFRDYVYIPLGGNRVTVLKHIRNIICVWLLTGIWHGASWNFVLWGAYYAVLLIVEKYITSTLLQRMPQSAAKAVTLLLVLIGWVIFANTDFNEMGRYLGNLIGIGCTSFADVTFLYCIKSNLVLLLFACFCCTEKPFAWLEDLTGRRPIFTVLLCAIMLIVSVAYLVGGSYNPFLYFRF